jgi:hypothetical protein
MRRLLPLVFVLAALTWGTLHWRAMGGGDTRTAAQVRTTAFVAMFVAGAITVTGQTRK